MPKRAKFKLSRIKKKSKDKLHKPLPLKQILNPINQQQQISDNNAVLVEINEADVQHLPPVEKQVNLREAIEVTTIHGLDNATSLKSTSVVEIDNNSETEEMAESKENIVTSTKDVLKLEEMIQLWNELCKIPIPQCKCYHKAKFKR